jgi:peptidoglycan/xylan/chitin deacetylase (PgdA/CDA1 family)
VIEGADDIVGTTGRDPRPWFRCPFGDGQDDPRVGALLSTLGYRAVGWGVEVADWEPWRSAGDVERDAVERTVERGDGAIVLLHTWPAPTAEALPTIVDRLADAGAAFVTVEDVVR